MIAKLLIGQEIDRLEKINNLLEEAALKNPHPDVLYFNSDSKLGIEQARKIKEHFSLKPYSAKGRAVALEEASNLTVEAQNALLKILEELPENGLFILGADSETKLLPTVISRCQIVRLPMPGMGDVDIPGLSVDIEKLLDSTVEERFEYVEKLKDREEFLHELVKFFYRNLNFPPKGAGSNIEFLKELLQAEEWQKQNVNIRGILEYLMLVMPQK